MSKRKSGDRLTHSFVKSVAKAGRYGDGRGGFGLSLLVQKTQNGGWSKTWSQRLHIGKARQEYTPGLGSFPLVTLADARGKAFENARLVKQGVDIRKPAAHVPTVAEAFKTVIALKSLVGEDNRPRTLGPDPWDTASRLPPCPSRRSHRLTYSRSSPPFGMERGATADKTISHLHSVMDWSITRRTPHDQSGSELHHIHP